MLRFNCQINAFFYKKTINKALTDIVTFKKSEKLLSDIKVMHVTFYKTSNINAGTGTEAALFHFWEYLFRIFGILSLQLVRQNVSI